MAKSYYYENDEILPVEFSTLASLIRMGHKYGIPTVLNEALSRLKKCYPFERDAWLSCEGRSRYVLSTPQDAITVVKLAHLTDSSALLPPAYLSCCLLLSSIYKPPHDRAGELVLNDLPAADFRRVSKGYLRLVDMTTNRILTLVAAAPAKSCTSPCPCGRASRTLLRHFMGRTVLRRAHPRAAFLPMDEWYLDHPSAELCDACEQAVRTADQAFLDVMWSALPVWFHIKVDDWPKIPLDAGEQS